MVRNMKNTDCKAGTRSRFARAALLSAAVAVSFGLALAVQVDVDHGLTVAKPAFAGNGNGGGNGNGNGGGNGNGNGNGNGQQVPIISTGPTPADEAIDAIADESGETTTTEMPLIAEDAPPATIEVVKELAGLPEESALSDEEELEAIRTGWGTWRTADGPETVVSQ